jgi:hypothetical protein
MSFFLLLILSIAPAFSGLNKLAIENLDLNYISPKGTGEFEKLIIGLSMEKKNFPQQPRYPVEILRQEDSFELSSPFVELQWLNPLAFFHNMTAASTDKLNFKLGSYEHYLVARKLKFTPDGQGEFTFSKAELHCKGDSLDNDPVQRLMLDCRQKMTATIHQLELPLNFLTEIADQLPDIPTEIDVPANDFGFNMENGNFYSHLRIKYYVRAYLRTWGHLRYEDDGKTIAIRIDQVKYGILPVTNLVMNELRRRVTHPNVIINPPWIRIKMDEK